MVRGSAWSIAMRWGIRLIGLVSVIILARLLTPEDFGIVAMGAITIALINSFSEVGVAMLLIRERDVGREEYDTAWTIKIVQGFFVSTLLVVGAPLAASYFGDDRVVAILYVLAIGAVLDGTQNIGISIARKELDFALDFRFHVYVRLVNFFLTVGLALLLQSYWALIYGRVLSSLVSVPLSFAMHPYRPRLSLARAGKYLRFSLSIVPLKFGRYLNNKVDAIVVGGLGGTNQLGLYNVAAELAAMLTHEILVPLGRGLMPNYSKLNHDPPQLAEAYGHVLRIAAAFILPLGFGLSAVAEHVVAVLLGSQWTAAGPLVEMLALYGMLVGLIHIMSNQILIASGHERRSALVMWIRLAVLTPVLVVASRNWGVQGVAVGAVCSALVVFPVVVWFLTRSLPLSTGMVVGAFWRPLLAAVGMAICVRWLDQRVELPAPLALLLEAAAGALVYGLILVTAWWIAGRPRGVEQMALGFLAARSGKAAS